jgi:prevent-host-death family protein
MTEIGASAAKHAFGRLLDRVERGEEIVIIRRGKPVARLAPLREHRNPTEALEAWARIRGRAEGVTLGGISIRELIDEGDGCSPGRRG